MINTTLMGTPSNAFDAEQYKFVVRTFYLVEEDMYVTDVYYLREEEHLKNINVIIPADSKEEAMNRKSFDLRVPLDWICNHRKVSLCEGKCNVWNSSLRKLGEQHLNICKEILNGKYWMGEIALP